MRVQSVPCLETPRLKAFSLIFALFWSVQALVCLPPEFGSRGEGDTGRGELSAADHHHEHSDAAVGAGTAFADESSTRPSSHEPDSNHHSESDGQCERHCASLDQSLAATPPIVVVPDSGDGVLVLSFAVDIASIQVLAQKIDAFELGLPPPDLLALNSALRI